MIRKHTRASSIKSNHLEAAEGSVAIEPRAGSVWVAIGATETPIGVGARSIAEGRNIGSRDYEPRQEDQEYYRQHCSQMSTIRKRGTFDLLYKKGALGRRLEGEIFPPDRIAV